MGQPNDQLDLETLGRTLCCDTNKCFLVDKKSFLAKKMPRKSVVGEQKSLLAEKKITFGIKNYFWATKSFLAE